jgi:SAM-dependent methyltransferase
MSAADTWRRMVEAEEAQTNELRTDDRGDYWAPLSTMFRDDPRRADDPTVEALSAFIGPDSTVLDVGAGAGRLALPLALRCRRVVAVEPSAAICDDMRSLAAEHKINNVDVVQATWQDAETEPADLVFAAHVVYAIADIDGFIGKMEDKALETAAVVLFSRPPLYSLNQFWTEVYGVERRQMPALPELLEVLWERGRAPAVTLLTPDKGQRTFPDEETAFKALCHRLFIGSDRPGLHERLRKAIGNLLEPVSDGLALKDVPPRAPAVVSWEGRCR